MGIKQYDGFVGAALLSDSGVCKGGNVHILVTYGLMNN
jgi:hypothetical protein